MATSNESKSIFVSTLEFIGSIVAVLLFATILFGIFTNSFERMLWQLFDWIVEILKPIASILLLIVAVFRGLPLLVSFMESIIEDMRAEKEYREVWDRLELSSPTPQVASTQKSPLEVKEEAKNDNPSESRGTAETIIVVVPEKNGGQFLHVIPNTKEHQEALARKAKAESELKAEINTGADDMLKNSNLYTKVVNQRGAN